MHERVSSGSGYCWSHFQGLCNSQTVLRCVADADVYYTLTVDAAPADRPDAYHALEVKIATQGLTARTRNGYYVQH
jgi:hypothetical protein